MGNIVTTPSAELDLAEMWHFIAIDNDKAADRLIDSIRDTLRRLADHPGMGTMRPELGSVIRSYPVGNYLLFYQRIEGGIELVRVIHGARNTRGLLRR